jgi:multicomponent Na+:H+ antiporter subunit B
VSETDTTRDTGPEHDDRLENGVENERRFRPSTRPYTESTVIMTTVRVVAPFVLTYGLFVMFHGADSSGGGFQGGAIAAATVIMVAFAFGIEPTSRWFTNTAVVGLAAGGVLVFLLIGVGPILLGANFLEYTAYKTALGLKKAPKYGIEGVELGIGIIVAGAISGLFFAIARGFDYEEGSS